MRFLHKHNKTAAIVDQILPFGGLGFETDAIRTAAQAMVPHCCYLSNAEQCLSIPDFTLQPSGYKLLVTLGREIRGR